MQSIRVSLFVRRIPDLFEPLQLSRVSAERRLSRTYGCSGECCHQEQACAQFKQSHMNTLESLLEGYHPHSMTVACELADLAIEFLECPFRCRPTQETTLLVDLRLIKHGDISMEPGGHDRSSLRIRPRRLIAAARPIS